MLVNICSPRLKVLALINLHTRRLRVVLFYTYLLSIISAITQECYLFFRSKGISNMSQESKPIGLVTQHLYADDRPP
ncbi:MAG: hypothetical protein EAZ09_11565 [Oscillatoriales cyanobacterium]|nr:MAG: hypothetical protein EAZ18_19960 [Oscillatoriales cyanobacterium]TAH21839.1 MAG: hypothetical protein EAZ09_11565 [Oscillatoriales cyanobacterium]